MADGTVDNLNIQLSANADKAVKSLNSLANTLNKVSKSFNGLNTKNITAFTGSITKLASSLRSINGIKVSVPNLTGLSKELSKISKIDFGKISSAGKPIRELGSALKTLSGLENISIPKLDAKNINSVINAVKKLQEMDAGKIPQVADGMSKISSSMSTLSTMNFNDTGLNKVVNALNRLFKADFSKFNPSDFSRITDSISGLGNMPDISSSVNRLVSSLSRLANVGEKTGQSASSISNLGQELKRAVGQFSSIGSINDDINMFVQSIARLASAGIKTGQAASGLSSLAKETLSFFNAMQSAPRISQNTIAMTQALAQLASAGGRVNTATKTITSAFSKLSSVGSKTLGVIKNVASGIVSSFQRIGSSSGGINQASFGLSNLLKTAIGFQVGQGLLDFGRMMFTVGSDITEVENVVNVAFGGMADKAYEFAQTAKEQFGLSELSALKYSGTMMAILNSSGVDQSAAAEMSTTLAGLAGDLASFYNIAQDDAWSKIMSAMAGEVEPMRRLGVSMTVANMEAYALSQGIDKSWQSMTQAEQAMLRYNYMMDATAQQQGDFARTSGTWANQIRILQLNIQSLAGTIGQGLIAAVLPAVKALNTLFAVLQRAANAVRDFFYVLTGYKPQSSGGGGIADAANDIGDSSAQLQSVGDAGDDAASGMDKASKSAKKLKNNMNTLGIDELNIISPDKKSDSGGSGGSGGGAGGGGGLDTGGLGGESIFDALGKSDPETPVNEWATRLRNAFLNHDWDKLGEEIAWGINTGLQKVYDAISWENVGPKITPAINAFTQTFNSMVDNINWTLMGQTFGAGVNTLVNTLNLLIEGIDWTNLGLKISEGVRGAISEIQWTNLGNLLGNYFMIAWNTLNGFVTGMAQTNMAGLTGFEQVGTAIGSAINGIFQKVDFGTIGTTLATGFNGIFDAIRALSITVDWNGIATNISTGLNNMIHGINWAESGQSLSRFVTDLLGTIKSVVEQTDWQSLGQGIGDFLGGIDWLTIFSQVFTTITTVIGGLVSGLANTTAGKLGIALGAAIGGIKLAGAGIPLIDSISDLISGTTLTDKVKSKITTAFTPVVGMFKEGGSIYTALSSGASALSGAFTALTGISAPVGVAVAAVAGVIVVVIASIKNLWDTSEKFRDAVTGAFDKVKNSLVEAFDKVKNAISPLIDAIGDLIDTFVDFYNGGPIKKVVELFGTLAATFAGNAISTGIDVLSTAFSGLAGILTGAVNTIEGVVKIIQGLFSFNFDKVAEGFKDVGDGILTAFSGMGTLLFDAGKDLISGLLEGVTDAISTIGSWIQDNIFKPFIDGFKSVFGIHSPSTVMSEQGGYIIDGLLSGLKNNITSVTDWFTELPGKIKDAAGDAKEWLKDKGSDAITGLKNGYESVKNSEFLDKVATLKDETFNKIGDIKTKVTTKGKNVVEGLKNGYQSIKESQFLTTVSTIKDETFARIGGMKDKITQKGKDVINGLKNGYTQIKESGFLNFVKNIKDETFSSIGNILKTIIPKGKDIIQGLKDGLDDKWPGLSDALSKFPEKIKKAIGDLKEIGKKIMQGLADGIASVDIKLPHITWDWKTLGAGDLSIKIPTNFGVKWYARGGLFDDPSIIGVGEAGREAVIPLENPRTMRMIATSLLENMPNGSFGASENIIKKAVESGVLSGMARVLSNASLMNHTYLFDNKDYLYERAYRTYPASSNDYSVEIPAGRTLERTAMTDSLLQQILDTNKRILAKDVSVKLDGKRTDKLLERARHNSGYNFVTT